MAGPTGAEARPSAKDHETVPSARSRARRDAEEVEEEARTSPTAATAKAREDARAFLNMAAAEVCPSTTSGRDAYKRIAGSRRRTGPPGRFLWALLLRSPHPAFPEHCANCFVRQRAAADHAFHGAHATLLLSGNHRNPLA